MNKFLAIASLVGGIGVFACGVLIASSPVEAKPVPYENIITIDTQYVYGEASQPDVVKPTPIAKKQHVGSVKKKIVTAANQVRYHELEQGGHPDADYVRVF